MLFHYSGISICFTIFHSLAFEDVLKKYSLVKKSFSGYLFQHNFNHKTRKTNLLIF